MGFTEQGLMYLRGYCDLLDKTPEELWKRVGAAEMKIQSMVRNYSDPGTPWPAEHMEKELRELVGIIEEQLFLKTNSL